MNTDLEALEEFVFDDEPAQTQFVAVSRRNARKRQRAVHERQAMRMKHTMRMKHKRHDHRPRTAAEPSLPKFKCLETV